MFFMKITRSQTTTIHLLAILFFPGVLIHELGHFLMASILLVPTGEIEFFPKIQEGGVKLGSVAIARTDPFRRLLVGVAPVVSGLGILFLASYYLSPLWPFSWRDFLFGYILFEVGNTMFSSKKDMEGALLLIGLLGFIAGGFFLLGARIPEGIVAWMLRFASLQLFFTMAVWLAMSAVLSLVLLILFRVWTRWGR
jgi:hypothetical protein